MRRIGLRHAFDFDPFEQQLQLHDIEFARRHVLPVRQQASLFEPLGPDAPAAAVPVQHLDLRGAPVDEGEQVTR
jgi:hypothetical protein